MLCRGWGLPMEQKLWSCDLPPTPERSQGLCRSHWVFTGQGMATETLLKGQGGIQGWILVLKAEPDAAEVVFLSPGSVLNSLGELRWGWLGSCRGWSL